MKKLLISCTVIGLAALVSFLPAPQPGNPIAAAPVKKHAEDSAGYYIIIDKSDYELKVYDEEGWYATYPVVFGSKDLGDKMKEGDRRTPDGQYKVILKKMHPKWGPELLLDYPTAVNVQRFAERKKKGIIPATAKIGGGIAIHATRPDEEWTIDNFYNWTDGCISVKYTEMKDLFSYIPVGTPVTIQQ
ncbi:MAG TPA: L,D-transpeptidase [Ferruginibacter sp.]|nr:L,D-transpeptidase [Ferruginibacter sp.]HMP19556.1 L,D-transpeptidase [Ferruginibacter sp.]